MMGLMLSIYAVPALSIALVVGALVGRQRSVAGRRAAIAAAILLASGAFTLLRTDGIIGFRSQFAWRWSKTPEDRLLELAATEKMVPVAAPAPAAPAEPARTVETAAAKPGDMLTAPPATSPAPATVAEWPGFRGPDRDGVARGVRVNINWQTSPPAQVWKRPIGPGWSSFAVSGDLIYTQEQRGEDEVVACYKLATGEPVWQHRDRVRFWESNAGAGPRATPTVSHDRVFTLGATGIANALDARTGAVVWSRNAATDTQKEIPDWGLASSPLVVGDVAIFAVAGRLVAYDAGTGAERWMGEDGGGGYSSPHLATIAGVPQVLLIRGGRTVAVAPADGKLLWEYAAAPAVAIVQPALANGSDVFIAVAEGPSGNGITRVSVARGPGGWRVEERWTSKGLKPYFNDFVLHNGHAFGFDGNILSCIDLADGSRKWKGGRYGAGQMVLLPEQDLLLVLSEEGELALVSATPDQFKEIARLPVIEGKTWNHPVVLKDVVLVRNGEEMAAFRLPIAAR
jgi:outer membrane protein assembly factor BamB